MSKLKQKSQITDRTKKILSDRKRGNSTGYIADLYGISRSRVCKILKDYGDPLPKKFSTDSIDKGIDKKTGRV